MQPKQQKIKKYLVYTGMVLIGCFVIYLVFAPANNGDETSDKLNKTLPDPEEKEIPKKNEAYIEDDNRMIISDMFLDDLDGELDLTLTSNQRDSMRKGNTELVLDRAKEARERANEAVFGISDMLASAAKEQEDREKAEEKSRQIEELEEKLRRQEADLKILQAQAEMASYIQPVPAATPANIIPTSENDVKPTATVMPVSVAETSIVSALNQNRRHGHFFGFDNIATEQKNTIRATTFGQQTVSHGQN
ncbi:MAG: hypothetical protein LBR10_16030, partial [Prevotellaceae bacterium]|nr:hypothetical protein [Prevotellaceae bacterium]